MLKISFIILLLLALFNLKINSLPAPPIFESVPHYPALCYLPPESGMCSPIQFKQKSSLQTGLENEINDQLNNFSEEGKINKWETSIEEEEKNEGNKYRLFTKYYFDSVTAQCYAFSTQNCGGNQNRFESIEECLNICKLLA